MAMKIENRSTIPVPHLDAQIQEAADAVPVEHWRGFTRIVLVDRIENARLPSAQTEKLPVLYHPRMPGMASAFGEIALGVLLPSDLPWYKRRLARAQLRAMLAQSVISLAAQHYLVTLQSRMKKKGPGLERALREYVEKYFTVWRDNQTGWRARLFRPLVPYLERWQKSAKKYAAEQARQKAAG
jgi:hypothetical protein